MGILETEIKEKKDRVEDALYATKAAIEEGIVAGGGSALLYAREAITYPKEDSDAIRIGKQIVYRACGKPFEQILVNAGFSSTEAQMIGLNLDPVNNWLGYDLKSGVVVNMKEAGIIDPAKVTRTALENAATVAGTVLLTECVVVDNPEDKKDDPMGGMGGMF